MAQILVIEDNVTMREGMVQILSRDGHDVRGAKCGLEGIQMFEQSSADFVISDLKMEDLNGTDVLRRIKSISPDAIVMMVTAFGTIETAVETMKLGAFDFITKPFPPDLLRMKVKQGLELVKVREENQYLRSERGSQFPDTLLGESALMLELKDQISKVAQTDSSVLIAGESGTGKELVARALHTQSKRDQKPFIKVDCTMLAEGVLESELFGHERGAFTGATQRKAGRFELADGGTIFLDEIGEISPHIQLKLLRVLQDRSFERVGGTRTIKVNVRVIAATNKDLMHEIKQGKFREDLYYRLHIVPIRLPALRERKEDIPLLTQHFLQTLNLKHRTHKIITPEAMAAFCAYEWPGNVRELENLLERMSVLSRSTSLGLEDLPEAFKKSNHYDNIALPATDVFLNEALEELEKKLILRAYKEAGGVKTKTAERLGIKTSALYYKLEKYGIYSKD